MQSEQTGPLIEALFTSVQQLAEQQAVGNEQLIGAIQEGAAQTQAAMQELAQTLISERQQPRTVRLSGGRVIEINPAQLAQ